MAGEVAAVSVILQIRLIGGLSTHDVIGAPGIARFDLSTSKTFKGPYIRAKFDQIFDLS